MPQLLRSGCVIRCTVLLLCLGSACVRPAPAEIGSRDPALDPVAVPAAAGSAEINLSVGASGLHVSWIERGEESAAVRTATLDGPGWSVVTTVAQGEALFANWADFPSVVELDNGTRVAHWLQRNGSERYAYGVATGRSVAGGEWQPSGWLHDDDSATEHGFVSLVPRPDGGLTAVWLDGRAFAERDGQPATQEMSLRARTFDGDGVAGPEALVDARICDCCQTSAVRVGEHVIAVYRDRSPDEVRDIKAVRLDATGWSEPIPIGNDGWQISGCPVNGPMVAAHDARAAVAWFGMREGEPTVQVVFSDDAGASFSAPITLASGAADDGFVVLGRVAVAWADDERVAVIWLEGNGENGRLQLATVSRDGVASIDTLVATRSARSSGFPRLVRDRATLWLGWTDPSSEQGVHLARLSVPAASD